MSPSEPRPGAFFDLSGRTKLRITGNDRLRYLNGQITNNINKAGACSAIAACVLNAKGRMNAHVFLFVNSDSVFLDADPELRASLPDRLNRYIISDDVEIEDVSDKFALFHLLDPGQPADNAISIERFRRRGRDLWVDISRHDAVLENLFANGSLCDELCAEVFRVEQGVPRWGRELTEEIIPVEANLEQSCIDYQKGCYIGQEVISRMKMSGQRNKSLFGFTAATGSKLTAGMRLHAASGPNAGREAGWITSVAYSERAKGMIALGYVKRGFHDANVRLAAVPSDDPSEASRIELQIVELPFNFRNA